MINGNSLTWLKPSALLINMARGGLVEIGALVAALESQRLGGAALDVLANDPPWGGTSPAGERTEPAAHSPHGLEFAPSPAQACRNNRQPSPSLCGGTLAGALNQRP